MVFAQVSKQLDRVLKNNYVSAGASLFLVLYAGMAKPQLPPVVAGLFDTAVFRLVVLTLVVFMSGRNLQLSILVAVAFTVTMNLLNEQKIAEGFMDGMADNAINENFLVA